MENVSKLRGLQRQCKHGLCPTCHSVCILMFLRNFLLVGKSHLGKRKKTPAELEKTEVQAEVGMHQQCNLIHKTY